MRIAEAVELLLLQNQLLGVSVRRGNHRALLDQRNSGLLLARSSGDAVRRVELYNRVVLTKLCHRGKYQGGWDCSPTDSPRQKGNAPALHATPAPAPTTLRAYS